MGGLPDASLSSPRPFARDGSRSYDSSATADLPAMPGTPVVALRRNRGDAASRSLPGDRGPGPTAPIVPGPSPAPSTRLPSSAMVPRLARAGVEAMGLAGVDAAPWM